MFISPASRGFRGRRNLAQGGEVFLDERVPQGSQSEVVFAGIPPIYRHLRLIGTARSTTAANSSTLRVQYNGDTGNNYNAQIVVGAGTGAAGVQQQAQASLSLGDIPAANATANFLANFQHFITFYCTQGVQFRGHHGNLGYSFSTASAQSNAEATGGLWLSSSPIHTIRLFPAAGSFLDFASRFTLFGIP